MAVTFSIAVLALGGTPPKPATGTSVMLSAARAPPLLRESNNRAGFSATKVEPVGTNPLTSMSRPAEPETYTHTWPLVPIRATTALAIVCPVAKLRFDASGIAFPHGNTVMNPADCASTAVTFNVTAAGLAGSPGRPVTVIAVTDPSARGPPLVRES